MQLDTSGPGLWIELGRYSVFARMTKRWSLKTWRDCPQLPDWDVIIGPVHLVISRPRPVAS